MRRLLTSVIALSLLVAGLLPMAAPVTANVCDHATIVSNGRLSGTLAVTTTKRSPTAPSNVPLFSTVVPGEAAAFTWTHELVVVPSSRFSSRPDRSAISPRAPPANLTSSLS